MKMISYSTKLTGKPEDLAALRALLQWERLAFNEASKVRFGMENNSLVILHSKFYGEFRESQAKIPSQIVIKAQQGVIAAYKTAKSNKHKVAAPFVKKRLSLRLDKRIYSKCDGKTIRITTAEGRREFGFVQYERLTEMFKHQFADPLVFERNGELYISFTFKVEEVPAKPILCLGVDLGIRVAAACSDGRLIIDKKFNKEKRKLRFLKRKLQSCGSKSARKHLKRLRRKEKNKNRNQTFLIANRILSTPANAIALENLSGIKAKKRKYQNKNAISQVPLYDLRRVITYKAAVAGKTVVLVSPAYTSQTDSVTGIREGKRCGRRFYAKSGLIYDADINAAVNIGRRSKLPVSQGFLLDGQGVVTRPNVCKSSVSVSSR